MDTGSCPIRMKTVTEIFRTNALKYFNLYVKGLKKFNINERFGLYEDVLFYKTMKGPMNDSIHFRKKDFFTLGDCSNSNCEILNHVNDQPQNFDIKCDFIKKKDGQVGKVLVVGEGVCPIEITGKNNEKQVYYVHSVKDGDAYKILMTNKRK